MVGHAVDIGRGSDIGDEREAGVGDCRQRDDADAAHFDQPSQAVGGAQADHAAEGDVDFDLIVGNQLRPASPRTHRLGPPGIEARDRIFLSRTVRE